MSPSPDRALSSPIAASPASPGALHVRADRQGRRRHRGIARSREGGLPRRLPGPGRTSSSPTSSSSRTRTSSRPPRTRTRRSRSSSPRSTSSTRRQTSEEIRQMGRRSAAMKMDVTNREQIREVFATDQEGLRIHRHPGQQRGHARPHRADRAPERRAVGPRPAREPDGRIQLHQGRMAVHARAELGSRHLHGVGRGHARRIRPGLIRRDQGVADRARQVDGARGCALRHHREHHRAGHHRHRGVEDG